MVESNLRYRIILFLSIIILYAARGTGQVSGEQGDSVLVRRHSPTTAMIMSAVIPGMGQVYNGKIWKVPILYGGEMAAINSYHYWQIRYRRVLNIIFEGDVQNDKIYDIYGRSIHGYSLGAARDYYRRSRDYSALFVAGIYVLNIIDAVVDAYFYEYDISNDLSFRIKPACIPTDVNYGGIGIQLSMRF